MITALVEAACCDQIAALRLIAKHTTNYNYALYNAVRMGKLASIRVLVELGATNFDTVLYNAAFWNRLDVVKLLLELHTFTDTDIDIAIYYAKNVEIIALLNSQT